MVCMAQTSHIAYLSALSVHELFLAPGSQLWTDKDLTRQAGAPLVVFGTPPITSWADQVYEHVAYIGSDQHVWELYFPLGVGPSWRRNDLTAAASGTPLSAQYAVGVTSWVDRTFQHIVFLGMDGHVWELYFRLGSGPWSSGDLTRRTSSPLPTAARMTSWVDPRFQHVVYQANNDRHLIELYFPLGGGSWAYGDLTAAGSAPLPPDHASFTSWVDSSFQHVAFEALGSLHELRYRLGSGPWTSSDLIANAGAPLPLSLYHHAPLTAWVDSTQHLAYVSADNHVIELQAPLGQDTWQWTDLSGQTGAPLPSIDPTTDLTSWVDETHRNVVYTSGSGVFTSGLIRLSSSLPQGPWQFTDLKQNAGLGYIDQQPLTSWVTTP